MSPSAYEEILEFVRDELATRRRGTLSESEQEQIASDLLAIYVYAQMLGTVENPLELVKFVGRALADVIHGLAAAGLGYGSPEPDGNEVTLVERNPFDHAQPSAGWVTALVEEYKVRRF
jgi:hypothetical protein